MTAREQTSPRQAVIRAPTSTLRARAAVAAALTLISAAAAAPVIHVAADGDDAGTGSVDALIRAADTALYEAKDAARNRVVQAP